MAPTFFNANGCYGKTCSSPTDFPKASDLLDHMDRLGIERSLVWYLPAEELNQTLGNRALLQEIDALPGRAQDRLIPAFIIAPTMLYAKGALDELITTMETRRVRALRYFQSSVGSFTLGQLSPLLDRVSRFKPLLMVQCVMGPALINDLLDVSGKYPDITFACMEPMWVHLPIVLDLMRQRANIVCDTSYLHTRDTIAMIAGSFGPERLIFGAGSKSANGASIAGLIYADITEKQQSLIAHENLERILGLDSLPRSTAHRPMPNGSLWSRYMRKEKSDIEIIDAHGHIGPVAKWVLQDRNMDEQIPEAIRWMDKTGISRMFVSGEHALYSDPVEGNRILLNALAGHRDRFSGYVVFNPYFAKELTPLFDEYFADDFFIGFKLLCDYWKIPLTDPGFKPVWEYADRNALPILIHTWEGAYDSPAILKDVIPKYRNATFILGHSGGTDKGRREAEELALANKNVYLDFCGSFCTRKTWEETIKLVGNDRVVFGSDSILHDQAWELGRLLSLDLPDEMLKPILSGNIRRILGKRGKQYRRKKAQ